MKRGDLTGREFGRLTVRRLSHSAGQQRLNKLGWPAEKALTA